MSANGRETTRGAGRDQPDAGPLRPTGQARIAAEGRRSLRVRTRRRGDRNARRRGRAVSGLSGHHGGDRLLRPIPAYRSRTAITRRPASLSPPKARTDRSRATGRPFAAGPNRRHLHGAGQRRGDDERLRRTGRRRERRPRSSTTARASINGSSSRRRKAGGKAARANLRGPTIIIVGSVVTLREKLNWRSNRIALRQRRAPDAARGKDGDAF